MVNSLISIIMFILEKYLDQKSFRKIENEISLFKPTSAKLYQKQYRHFGCMTSIKMQTIITYSIVRVITEYIND